MLDTEFPATGQEADNGDDSDSASDSSDGHPVFDCNTKSLATLEKEIKDGTWNVTTKKGNNDGTKVTKVTRQEFIDQYSTIIRERSHISSNIFHILAGIEDKISQRLKKLVEWSVEIAGDLLDQQDNHGQTGLHKAIHNDNYRMLKYLLDAYGKHSKDRGWNLDQILRVTNSSNGDNVVHLAMRHMTPVSQRGEKKLAVVQKFINNASIDTLKMKNKDGLTPLHLAVQGEKCTVSQLDIVKTLIGRCEEALDVREHNHKFNSVYQHHNSTFDIWKKNTASDTMGRKSYHLGSKKQGMNIENGGSFNSRAKEIARGDDNCIPSFSAIVRTGTNNNLTGPAAGTKAIPDQQERQKDEPLSVTIADQPIDLLQVSLSPRESTKLQVSPRDEFVTEKSVYQITEYLKHTYLRKKSRQDSLDFLYGGIAEKQIDFNISGKEGEIPENDFKAGYKCANLEDTLQCVRIPYLVIKPTPQDQSRATYTDEQLEKSSVLESTGDASVGRTDLCIVFNWLWSDAEVSKIIKLSVDDSHYPPHRDEAIEKAAKQFHVEIWDWQKIDLCGETIAKAAPGARWVNLYWSGNNAVLRGWSDPEGGLANLPHLEKVTIFLQAGGVESDMRNKENIESFKVRLKQHVERKDRPIHVDFNISSSSTQKSRSSPMKKDDAVQIHRWHKCMRTFGQFFRQVERKLKSKPPPIKIAIIDDGIDTTEPSLHNYIKGGQCFCSKDESPSFCVSAGGHGTVMARLISRIFPQVEILSLKLDEYIQSDGTSQFSVSSAIKAIRWAKTAGVSIVNMSWSIEKTEANENLLIELRKAVNDAEDANILMFCSANDQGKTKDSSYPGIIRRGTLFKIGAATAAGEESNYVSLDDVDFLFPGREIEQDPADDASSNGVTKPRDRSIEGSSLATAFASGLAGLILHIFQLVSHHHGNDKENSFVKMSDILLKNPAKMKEIFGKLATDKKFVEVWRVFENVDELLKTGGRDDQNRYKILSDICTWLMN